MELLHYPGAGETRAYLEEELRRQQLQRQLAAQLQQLQQTGGGQPAAPQGTEQSTGREPLLK